MAIGVSYTGHDGRRVDFTAEGNPAPGSDLDRIVRGADAGAGEVRRVMTPLSDAMRRARRPQGPDPRVEKAAGTVKLNAADHRPGTLEEKIARDGSIEAGQTGLKLKGEDATRTDGIYAKKNGQRGFLSLDQIDDPNLKGGLVGEPDGINRLAPAASKAESQGGAFSENMQSRTEAEVNEETGEVTFWEYTKKWDVTSGRRVGGVSGETKRKICSFFLGGGDRQITYTRPRAPFTVLRSHYKDADGKTQYEFWAKCLKWGKHRNETQSVGAIDDLDYSTNRLCSANANGVLLFDGVYGAGDYGHYPQRPEGRPRKLVFDSGREALVDVFEERSTDAHFHDGCNCWTYIGGSEDGKIMGEDCEDGNMSLYGAFFKYFVPYKTTYSEPVENIALELDFGGPYYLWSKPGISYSYSGHWNYEWGEQLQMCLTPREFSQHDLFEFLLAKTALVSSAFTHDDYDKNVWRKTYVGNGDTLIDAVRSPDCNENNHFRYVSSGWTTACLDTDMFPSLAHLEGSLRGNADFESHDYTVFDEYYYYSGGRHNVYYPDGIQQYIDFELDKKVKSWVSTESNKLYGPFNDGFGTYASDWNVFYNYATCRKERYNGKWQDYFPFFIGDQYGFMEYLWHRYWYVPGSDEMRRSTPKVCEIRGWEIVENEVGNLFCYVRENAKGEILDVQLKKFGDVVKDGKEDVVIKDDLVVVER